MGRTYTERRTIALDDITTEKDFDHSSNALAAGARSVLAVPVLRDDETLGVMVLARTQIRPFAAREVELVETFADQAAIAIQNVRLFNEIQDKSRQLEVASRHKSEFLANMSHELRTPLNAVIGFSEVLLQGIFGDINEKQREYLTDVLGSGQHLLSLINDILDLSKIEAGRMELDLSTFALRDALESGLTIVRERAARHGIELSTVVASDVGTIEADERKVKQILYNLLSNAVKFTPDGGRVAINVRVENGDVRIEVRDTGIGVAPDDQERIFEEFRQVGRERSREGTGLGLTLTKRFVELHGGRIWLESTPGKGSTFTFILPMRRAAAVTA
jgi:signal transduction histidine kinase